MRKVVAAVAMALTVTVAPARGAAPLQPYQMVRSLQLVQDRIASGDHAALPMQNKLLEMIDARLRDAGKEEFADRRNFNAMLVYAMSGGNPATIEAVLLRLDLEKSDATLAGGVLSYLRGQQGEARKALYPVDPMSVSPELGAFLALVKASITTTDDAAVASRLFDQARLLGPGTLVEEAALRRSLGLAMTLDDAGRFVGVSSQYVRRYLRSPYASQFADAFIEGIIALRASIDLKSVEEIVAAMDADQRKFIYLRLARRSAIDGLSDLSAFASRHAEEVGDGERSTPDPRAELYSNLAAMTTETAADTLVRLKAIDRGRLSENDRRLLEAAEAVAAEIISVPGRPHSAAAAKPQIVPAAVTDGNASEDGPDAAGDSEVSGNPEDLKAEEAIGIAAPAEATTAETAPAEASAGSGPEATVSEARKKLDAVDKLLGETAE